MSSSDALRDCSNTAAQNSAMEEISQPQRKRPASSLVNSTHRDGGAATPLTKRSKLDTNNNNINDKEAAIQNDTSETPCTPLNVTPNIADFSVEQFLSVPLDILFRKVPSCPKRKPLLTRAEAQLLHKTALLAAEMDMLVDVSSQALGQQVWCSRFATSIETVPFLRPVLCLLQVHGMQISSSALESVETEMSRVLEELSCCAAALLQYSEQNWTVSESLLDAFGDAAPTNSNATSGHELAQNKKFLAELQEEVATRIQALVQMSNHDLETDKHQWAKGGMAVPMKQFCQDLFGITDNVAETNRFAEQEAALQQQPPQDEHVHETTPSVNGEKQVAAMEKRTNPEVITAPPQQQQEELTTSLPQEKGDKAMNPVDTNTEDVTSISPRDKEHEELNENPLLALADEAEEHGHNQWSASTVSIHSPVKKHLETDESEEEYGEMTQGTSNAVAALTVLASGGRGK